MIIKTIVDEDFLNYKKPSMYIGTAFCDGKCCIEAGIPLSVCQNNEWAYQPNVAISDKSIIERYLGNDITKAICFGGLEPFEQFDEIFNFISKLRTEYHCLDTVIIYTGFNKKEIENEINALKLLPNIIIKFGRFIPNREKIYDDLLGIYLISDNQYAEKIS